MKILRHAHYIKNENRSFAPFGSALIWSAVDDMNTVKVKLKNFSDRIFKSSRKKEAWTMNEIDDRTIKFERWNRRIRTQSITITTTIDYLPFFLNNIMAVQIHGKNIAYTDLYYLRLFFLFFSFIRIFFCNIATAIIIIVAFWFRFFLFLLNSIRLRASENCKSDYVKKLFNVRKPIWKYFHNL